MLQLGIDIGGTNIKCGIVDDITMDIVCSGSVPFPHTDCKGCCEVAASAARAMLAENKIDMAQIESVGVAVPGSIDDSGSIVIAAYNLGFHNAPLKEEMEKVFPGKPVFIANDANTAALAELYAGAFRGKKTAVLITIGTGTGGGLILGGKMFNGGQNQGVELGHMTLKYGGEMCSCGNAGCVESYCTASWLAKRGAEVFANSPGLQMLSDGKIENVSAKIVVDAARNGDSAAAGVFEEFLDYLAAAISSIATLLDPEVIAIGGGVSEAGDILYKPLRRKVKERVFFSTEYSIVPAQLGNSAGIVGAAMLLANSR